MACLQELKADDRRFPAAALQAAGYSALWQGQPSWNGVAILARGREPRELRRGLPGAADDDQSRYLEAEVDGLVVGCLYLPNGNPQPGPKFDYKLAWFERLIAHAATLVEDRRPVVLAGDYNVVPTDDDIYDPKSWRRDALLQPQSRDAYARLLGQGWIDALRARHPDERVYTFWDYFRNHWTRNAGLRIDHLLLNRRLAPRLREAGVDRWVRGEPKPSDHAPVWITLDAGASRAPAKQRGKPKSARTSKRDSRSRSNLAPPLPAGARRAAPPATLAPMLATLVDAPPPVAAEWTFEVKFDGYRILARLERGRVRLVTRNGHDWTAKLRPLARALESMQLAPGWLDGEIVLPTEHDGGSFQALQQAFGTPAIEQVRYYVFDVPFHAGRDLTQVPLVERRAYLKALLADAPPAVRFSETFEGTPEDLVASACRLGLEGVIGKRRQGRYVARRSPDWIKLKCAQRQEFVISGWTDPKGNRAGLGSLLLGVHDGDRGLVYAGKVGTGFDDRSLATLRHELDAIPAARSPFSRPPPGARGVHWVQPKLLAEVTFAEWTKDGHLRHPVFHGLRSDKPAIAIVREEPVKPLGQDREEPQSPIPSEVRVSSPARVIDASTGTTKLELVRYYARAAPVMFEHVAGRPVSMLRAPRGIERPMFFQRHLEQMRMQAVEPLDPSIDPDHPPYVEIAEPLGIVSAAQMNVIEFHTWNATSARIAQPDRITFDLDPGEGVEWPRLQQAATLVRGFLDELGLVGFLKTSGGKGLHVVVPIQRRHDWDSVKTFSGDVVRHLARTLPKLFVAKSGPRNRVGKIYADFLRNGFGATTVSAWSVRARPGLGVSVPVAWDELDSLTGGAHWSLANVGERLAVGNAPWSGYRSSARSIARAIRALEAVAA